jgi:hypothetical protein
MHVLEIILHNLNASSCKHGNEPSSFIKRQIIYLLSYQLLAYQEESD